MSRQNKARQKAIIAKQITELHKSGSKGPSRTTPSHGKVKTARALELAKRIADAAAAEAQLARDQVKQAAKPANKKPAGAGRPQTNKPAAGRKVAAGAVAK